MSEKTEVVVAAELAAEVDEAVRAYDDNGVYGVACASIDLLNQWAPIVAAARAWGAAHEDDELFFEFEPYTDEQEAAIRRYTDACDALVAALGTEGDAT